MSPNVCERCRKPADPLCRIEIEVGPCPEAPHGYGSEVELCERCYLVWTEGLDEVDREPR